MPSGLGTVSGTTDLSVEKIIVSTSGYAEWNRRAGYAQLPSALDAPLEGYLSYRRFNRRVSGNAVICSDAKIIITSSPTEML